MVLTEDLDLPEFEELEMEELPLTQAHLVAAGPYMAKACEAVFNEFMYCRQVLQDPRECTELGREVTDCARDLLIKVKMKCLDEHNQYANCIDKSSGNFKTWPCRKTHAAYKSCMKECLDMDYPGFGYFARAKVHKTKIENPKPRCPCDPFGGEPKSIPNEKDFPRKEPRFGSRYFWMTE